MVSVKASHQAWATVAQFLERTLLPEYVVEGYAAWKELRRLPRVRQIE